MAEDRKTESLAAYYEALTDMQKTALRAVAMDMWEPYIGATCDGLPEGDTKIVFDKLCATPHSLSYGATVVMCRA